MTPNLLLCLLAGLLVGCGVHLLLARSVVRALLGFLLLGNGINLLFVVAAGPRGRPPIVGLGDESQPMADPLPQAMSLTAIVITLAMTGFVLALAHRSWQLSRSDVVEDDPEDARIGLRALENDMSESDFHGGPGADPRHVDPDEAPPGTVPEEDDGTHPDPDAAPPGSAPGKRAEPGVPGSDDAAAGLDADRPDHVDPDPSTPEPPARRPGQEGAL
ncbi:Na(+)/H(+) antiporter subunit C [Desertihabitans brevis]|uniref:Na(+)/H(+) antiporter subunit C n=1 Tax=Desertihabitans brevis TaxID=2268447 RepID=A0A367YVV0_9ACTN|nr:Na(+)/H(+) antiporter subunit C [Desertihabitans brevis]RCK70004.1 Na(+)/H(+) antiporter subunit C [Desertihabitans brevis]